MKKTKFQVFVSSTYEDLKEERKEAVSAILNAGHIPAGMEVFQGGKSTIGTIKKWIDDSDVFVLILGGKYGTYSEDVKMSFTQMEYEYAISQKKLYSRSFFPIECFIKKQLLWVMTRYMRESEKETISVSKRPCLKILFISLIL